MRVLVASVLVGCLAFVSACHPEPDTTPSGNGSISGEADEPTAEVVETEEASEEPSEVVTHEETEETFEEEPEPASSDEVFLAKIRDDSTIDGFVGWSDKQLTTMAVQVCNTYNSGAPYEEILQTFVDIGIDMVFGFYFIADASEVYCPDLYEQVKDEAGY